MLFLEAVAGGGTSLSQEPGTGLGSASAILQGVPLTTTLLLWGYHSSGEKVWLTLFLRLLAKTSSALCAGIVPLSRQWGFVWQYFLGLQLWYFLGGFFTPALEADLLSSLPLRLGSRPMLCLPVLALCCCWNHLSSCLLRCSRSCYVNTDHAVLCVPGQKALGADFQRILTIGPFIRNHARWSILLKACPKFHGCE